MSLKISSIRPLAILLVCSVSLFEKAESSNHRLSSENNSITEEPFEFVDMDNADNGHSDRYRQTTAGPIPQSCPWRLSLEVVLQPLAFDRAYAPLSILKFVGSVGPKSFYASNGLQLNWTLAWEFCRSHDMVLASLDSMTEVYYLRKFLAPEPVQNWWLSGNDMGREGNWVWMSTGQNIGWPNWSPGQPDDYQHMEDCLMIYASDYPRWNDQPCSFVSSFICHAEFSQLRAVQHPPAPV